MAAATERLDPVLKHLTVVKPLRGNPAAQVHNPVIHQTPQTHCSSFLGARERVLMRSQPIDFIFRDHTRGQAFEKQLTQRHWRFVTKSLHHVVRIGAPRAQPTPPQPAGTRQDVTFF